MLPDGTSFPLDFGFIPSTLAVPAVSHLYGHLKQAADLDDGFIDNLIQFWIDKDRLEGKAFRCLGVKGPKEAAAQVKKTAAIAAKKG
jgi:inorganic pyrophosphatase